MRFPFYSKDVGILLDIRVVMHRRKVGRDSLRKGWMGSRSRTDLLGDLLGLWRLAWLSASQQLCQRSLRDGDKQNLDLNGLEQDIRKRMRTCNHRLDKVLASRRRTVSEILMCWARARLHYCLSVDINTTPDEAGASHWLSIAFRKF